MQTLYSYFNLPPLAPYELIHARYRELARKLHPDVHPESAGLMRDINYAWGVLKNRATRDNYNKRLECERKLCPQCKGAGEVSRSKKFTVVTRIGCTLCRGTGLR